MKFISALVVLGMAVAAPQDHLNLDVFGLDVEGFVKDPCKMRGYSDCLLDLGECSALGAAVKNALPEALATGCAKCTLAQRQVIRRVILNDRQQLPDETERLIQKYDLQEKYHDAIEKFLTSNDMVSSIFQ